MSKYDKFNQGSRMQERPWKIHPIWRGIGCLMMLLIPIMSYAGAVVLVQANLEQGWLPMPGELLQTVAIPFVGDVEQFFAVVIVTVLLMIIGFGVVTILYSLIYSAVGPPRLGPLDAPPVRNSPKKKKY
jgi:hypothetical protein